MFALLCDPWDYELARTGTNGHFTVELACDLGEALSRLPAGRVAIASLEMMPVRFVLALSERSGTLQVRGSRSVCASSRAHDDHRDRFVCPTR